MQYTGIVTYPKGNSIRPAPSTNNSSIGFLGQGAMFEFDTIKQISSDNVWAAVEDGWMALRYPGTIVARADWWETGSLVKPENLFRHKHDFELKEYSYTARVNSPDWKNKNMRQAPEVYGLYLKPSLTTGGDRTNIEKWESFCRELNPGKNKWNYFVNPHSGLFNQSGWPKIESLAMGGNIFEVIDEERGFYRVKTLRADIVANIQYVNYWRTPHLIHRFNVITASNRIIAPNPGEIYYPLVKSYGEEAWIPKVRLVEV